MTIALRVLLALLTTLTVAASIPPSSAAPDLAFFSDDFSTDPNTNGLWRVHRYTPDTQNQASWDATAQTLFLTRAAGYRAVAMFANFQLTAPHWEAQFRYKVGGGSGADGFVFMFYKNADAYGQPGCGGSLGFQFGNCVPSREIAGYGIEFDSFYNAGDNIGDPYG